MWAVKVILIRSSQTTYSSLFLLALFDSEDDIAEAERSGSEQIRPCFENTLFPVAHQRPFLLYGAKLLLDYDFMNLVNFKLHMRI